MRAEFVKLKEYGDELALNFQGRVVMLADRLILTRNHIELCDHLAETPMETFILFKAFTYWERCRLFWIRYKPATETDEVPILILKTKKHPGEISEEPVQTQALVPIKSPDKNTVKPWKTNADDRRFLRSLRISSDEQVTDPDKDDDKNKSK